MHPAQIWTPRPVHRAWGAVDTLQPEAAVGADWKITMPAGFLTRIVRGTAVFTASAQAAERFVAYEITDGVGQLALQLLFSPAVKAGEKRQINFVVSSAPGFVKPGSEEVEYGLVDMLFQPEWVFKSFTENIQTEDKWTKMRFAVEKFEMDPDHPIAELRAAEHKLAEVERILNG